MNGIIKVSIYSPVESILNTGVPIVIEVELIDPAVPKETVNVAEKGLFYVVNPFAAGAPKLRKL